MSKNSSAAKQTEFQLYKNAGELQAKIFDFTEFKLMNLVKITTDNKKRLITMDVLNDYRNGKIAVAWRSGQPVWVVVVRKP